MKTEVAWGGGAAPSQRKARRLDARGRDGGASLHPPEAPRLVRGPCAQGLDLERGGSLRPGMKALGRERGMGALAE